MKTIRNILIAAVLVAAMGSVAIADDYDDSPRAIRPRPRNLQVWVWPNRGEGATYYAGDPIEILVEANRDCFITVYNIDTRGRMRVLYPYGPYDDNFIEGGRTYTLPGIYDDVEWSVEGPPGVELVQVVASTVPIDMPLWPVYFDKTDCGPMDRRDSEFGDFTCCGEDKYGFVQRINSRIIGRHGRYTATDMTEFVIARRPWYRHRPRINIGVDISWNSGYHHPWWDVCDLWPEIFYGGIWINEPIGSRIYIDGVYIGVAPVWYNARRYGRVRVSCYDGRRLIRDRWLTVEHKRNYYRSPRAPKRYRAGGFHRAAEVEHKATRRRGDSYRKLPRSRPGGATRIDRPDRDTQTRDGASGRSLGKSQRDRRNDDKRGERMAPSRKPEKKKRKSFLSSLAATIGAVVSQKGSKSKGDRMARSPKAERKGSIKKGERHVTSGKRQVKEKPSKKAAKFATVTSKGGGSKESMGKRSSRKRR